jgi:hypothetical protein
MVEITNKYLTFSQRWWSGLWCELRCGVVLQMVTKRFGGSYHVHLQDPTEKGGRFLRNSGNHLILYGMAPKYRMSFWVLAPSRFVDRCQRIGGTYRLHLLNWTYATSNRRVWKLTCIKEGDLVMKGTPLTALRGWAPSIKLYIQQNDFVPKYLVTRGVKFCSPLVY